MIPRSLFKMAKYNFKCYRYSVDEFQNSFTYQTSIFLPFPSCAITPSSSFDWVYLNFTSNTLLLETPRRLYLFYLFMRLYFIYLFRTPPCIIYCEKWFLNIVLFLKTLTAPTERKLCTQHHLCFTRTLKVEGFLLERSFFYLFREVQEEQFP